MKINKKTKSNLNKLLNVLIPSLFLGGLILIWQIICWTEAVPSYMLPSPAEVWDVFIFDFHLLMEHLSYTLVEALSGLALGIFLGFVLSLLMDRWNFFYRGFNPILIITQTIPTIAIAPLLVLWLGFEMAPKIVLVTIMTFFPIAVGLLDGYRSVDKDSIDLLRSMGANNLQIYRHLKIPASMNNFFSSLKISVTYSIVGAVIAEWLGGYMGIGVYMIRVKYAYSYDKLFAAIFVISACSLLLLLGVSLLRKLVMRFERASIV